MKYRFYVNLFSIWSYAVPSVFVDCGFSFKSNSSSVDSGVEQLEIKQEVILDDSNDADRDFR